MKRIAIRQKIWLTIIFISLFTIIVALSLSLFLYQKFYVDKQTEMLLHNGRLLAEVYYQEAKSDLFAERLYWTNKNIEGQVLFTDDPMLLSGGLPFELNMAENLISFEERQKLLAGEEVILIREHHKFGKQILAVVIPLIEQGKLTSALFLYMSLSALSEPFEPLWITLLVIFILLFLGIVWVAHRISNHLILPIQQMTEITKKMTAGDWSQRLHVEQGDELGELADSFNYMSSSLEKEESKRREFLANVSHELRTPISYIKAFTEALEEQMIDHQKYIEVMNKETGRLERLVHDLLDLAQLEGESYPMQQKPLPFAQLIEEVLMRYSFHLQEKKMHVHKEIDDGLIVYGDQDRLEQVINNLIDNALRYSASGKNIYISLVEQEKQAVLTIRDEGEGIPPEDLPKIMERFYRVNKARSRKDGGTGLGLAIAKQIIKKHAGQIQIDSHYGEGTTITITLPLWEDD